MDGDDGWLVIDDVLWLQQFSGTFGHGDEQSTGYLRPYLPTNAWPQSLPMLWRAATDQSHSGKHLL